MNIKKNTFKSLDKIAKASPSELLSLLDTVKNRSYKYINKVLPKYFKLKTTNIKKVYNKLQTLKMSYARTNYVDDIKANIAELILLIVLARIGMSVFYVSKSVKPEVIIMRTLKDFMTSIKKHKKDDGVLTILIEGAKKTFTKAIDEISESFTNEIKHGHPFGWFMLLVTYISFSLLFLELVILLRLYILDYQNA